MFDEWRATAIDGDGPAGTPVTVPGRPDGFVGADGVRYETSFTDPRVGGDEGAVVELRGLYAHAEVTVGGERLDGAGPVEHDAYFEPLRVPVIPEDETDITVTCYAPRDRFGGLYDTDRVPPADRVPGIWWDASVESHPLPFIDRIRVQPELTDVGAVLHVRTTVVTDGPLEDRLTYSLKPEGDLSTRGTMSRGAIEATDGGRTTARHTIEVHDPSLWWPRDLGDQHRYTLRAKLGDSERAVTTGIREVERDGGRLLVNGDPLPIRGVNLHTADPEDVDRATAINANLVRAPAHVLPREVYEACDEAGLLVWQGLPLTGPGAFDPERGTALGRTLVGTYGRHPSLAAVGVHDEPTEAFADGLGEGFFDRLRLRWRAWRVSYDRSAADAVADSIPDSVPIVTVVGGPGLDHDAAAYYPGWDYGSADDIGDILDRYPTTLLAAYGAGALATNDADARTVAGFDTAKHDAHVDGGVEESQDYQADVLRTVTETARRRGLGAVAAVLRDTDAAGMGVYAADGTPKAARDALATAFQPIQAFLSEAAPGNREVVVVNDAPKAVSATLAWAAGDTSGEREVTVDAAGRWTGTIDVPADADGVRLHLRFGEATVENTYDL